MVPSLQWKIYCYELEDNLLCQQKLLNDIKGLEWELQQQNVSQMFQWLKKWDYDKWNDLKEKKTCLRCCVTFSSWIIWIGRERNCWQNHWCVWNWKSEHICVKCTHENWNMIYYKEKQLIHSSRPASIKVEFMLLKLFSKWHYSVQQHHWFSSSTEKSMEEEQQCRPTRWDSWNRILNKNNRECFATWKHTRGSLMYTISKNSRMA